MLVQSQLLKLEVFLRLLQSRLNVLSFLLLRLSFQIFTPLQGLRLSLTCLMYYNPCFVRWMVYDSHHLRLFLTEQTDPLSYDRPCLFATRLKPFHFAIAQSEVLTYHPDYRLVSVKHPKVVTGISLKGLEYNRQFPLYACQYSLCWKSPSIQALICDFNPMKSVNVNLGDSMLQTLSRLK